MTRSEIHRGEVYPAAQAVLLASAALENAPYELTAVTAGSVAPFASCGKGNPAVASSCGSGFPKSAGLAASCNVKIPQSCRSVEAVASCGGFPEAGLGVGRVASCGGSPLNNNRGVEAVVSCGSLGNKRGVEAVASCGTFQVPDTGLNVGRVASCGSDLIKRFASCGKSPLTVSQAASCSDI